MYKYKANQQPSQVLRAADQTAYRAHPQQSSRSCRRSCHRRNSHCMSTRAATARDETKAHVLASCWLRWYISLIAHVACARFRIYANVSLVKSTLNCQQTRSLVLAYIVVCWSVYVCFMCMLCQRRRVADVSPVGHDQLMCGTEQTYPHTYNSRV